MHDASNAEWDSEEINSIKTKDCGVEHGALLDRTRRSNIQNKQKKYLANMDCPYDVKRNTKQLLIVGKISSCSW